MTGGTTILEGLLCKMLSLRMMVRRNEMHQAPEYAKAYCAFGLQNPLCLRISEHEKFIRFFAACVPGSTLEFVVRVQGSLVSEFTKLP